MNIISIAKIAIGVSGAIFGVYASTKSTDESEKDLIIEDLANRYNELVEKINNGEIFDEDLEDMGYDDEDDEDDEDDDEYKIIYEDEDDNEELAYYPGKYVHTIQNTQNTLSNSYSDLEKFYNERNEEIPTVDENVLTNINACVGMLGTAYQLGYMEGLVYYKKQLETDTKILAKLKHIENQNMVELMRDIKTILEMTSDFMNHMLSDESDNDNEDENTEVDGIDNFVVPVHHKGD